MIIDSLAHVTPDGKWFNTGHDASEDRLLREMDNGHVEQSVVVALAGYIDNEYVHEVCAQSDGRLIPGASLNPTAHDTPKQAAAEAWKILGSGDFPVLKLHPRLNGYDPLDPRCLALLRAVSEMQPTVRIWLDSIFRNSKVLLSKHPVDTVQTLLHTFPDLQFILLHGGGPLLLQMTELLSGYPNLTMDISLTAVYYHQTSLLQDIIFLLDKRDQRVVAGSDFPEFVPTDYLKLLDHLAHENGVTPKKLAAVLGANLAAVLHG